MTMLEAATLAEELAWQTTKNLFGPCPWTDEPDELFDHWIGHRDSLRKEILDELVQAKVCQPFETLEI